MKLQDLLGLYVGTRECSVRYRESLLRTVRKAVAAGLTDTADLQPARVNQFLAGLSTPAATTRQNIRRELLTLWRYAFEEGVTEVPPLRVAKIRARSAPPRAWSLKELQRLLSCAEADETQIGGLHSRAISEYMPAWILIAYETGMRFGDVLSLTSKEYSNGFITKIAGKTGKPLVRPLSPHATKLFMQLAKSSPDGTIFQWFITRRRALLAWRAFLDRHGFDGSSKFLRRSCATLIEAERPGEASRYLQHSSPTLVGRHYIDQSLIASCSGPPPIR